MAVTVASDLEVVQSLRAHILNALNHLRRDTTISGVDQSVPVSELAALADELSTASTHQDLSYRFAAVETAAREVFYTSISASKNIALISVDVWNLLDLLLLCGDNSQCAPELVCWLIEELLDSQTTDRCRLVFDYLESRRERLAAKDFHKKNLVFLRSCNELLRRLSKAEDAVFCGRVFFFLFQTFPLGDKSSVNLRGEFHVENTTNYDTSQDAEITGGDAMEVDTTAPATATNTPKAPSTKDSTPQPNVKSGGKSGSKSTPPKVTQPVIEEEVLDSSKLYPIFWRLQQDFSDPTRLFDQPHFHQFKNGLAATIVMFRKTPTVQAKAAGADKRGTKRKQGVNGLDEAAEDHFVDNYNPKYLTSRDLFNLELSDLAFQRHIFVQALILIEFLLSLTEKAKLKIAALPVQKSMLYSFTLDDADTKWALSTKATIKQSLQSTSDGRFYDRMVETVLARDKNWVRWKVESCPSIVRDTVATSQELDARRAASDYVRPRRLPGKPANAMNLDFLNEGQGGGLDALRDPSRYSAPGIEDLLSGIDNDTLDLEMATEEEAEQYRNMIANKTWRLLREARSSRLALLGDLEKGGSLKEVLNPREPSEQRGSQDDEPAPAVELMVPADDAQLSGSPQPPDEQAMQVDQATAVA
ncbi:hypothetical protein B0A48_06589 [Cryoendolithus antarcticus]|uniref:Nuclear matrix protein n=1 Tax=Cryoendolithus antarcticus TaxID=1507870 RepID=A0A1V8T989_9PEZI|nr:hypothetical protein B0A48_06589 [Cryoendolithus antarcticus]